MCYTLYQRPYRILVTHDIRETDLYKPTGFFLNPFLHCIVIVNVYMYVEFIYMNKIYLNQKTKIKSLTAFHFCETSKLSCKNKFARTESDDMQ